MGERGHVARGVDVVAAFRPREPHAGAGDQGRRGFVVLAAAEDFLAHLDAGIERRARPDVPVDANDVVAAQLLGVAGELIVVVALRDRIADQRRIGQREQIQNLPAHRMDHGSAE